MSLDSNTCKEIIDSLPLLDKDKELLKANRGFSDEVIAKMKIRSIGPFCEQFDAIQKIPEKIRKSFIQKDNTVIPFFNEYLDITTLKPHKYNLPDDELQLYCPWPLININSENVWVMTEGEFKAIAAAQLGFNAMAVPGIGTFTRKHFHKLVTFFDNVKPKGIIICFDNEYKDKPEYERYKADYTKRYDSQFYAYVNAVQLAKTYPNVLICTLPLSRHIDGKVDIDGLLSQGITRQEFGTLLSESLSPAEYRAAWKKLPRNHLSFLERRVDKWFYNGPITVNYNRYYIKKNSSPDEETGASKQKLQEVSNFKFTVINTVKGESDGSGEVQRLVRLESNYGTSDPFILTSEMMASKSALSKVIMSKGDYSLMMPDNMLQELWRYLFMHQSGLVINSINTYGYDKPTDSYVFGNGMYRNQKFYPSDNNNIVQVEEEFFKIAETEERVDLPVPILVQEEPTYTLDEMFQYMVKISDEHFARMFFGWVFGCLFCDLIMKKYGMYPFLYLDGAYGSGKSTIAGFAMEILGMPNSKGIPLQGSTKVAMRNISTRYSYLPVHFDESRQSEDGTVVTNSYFRSIYDRSTMIKGSKKDGEIITKTASANCIVSGEEAPTDAATSSRFIILSVSKHTHKRAQNKEAFQWLINNKSTFSYWAHSIMLQKEELWVKVQDYIDEYIDGFKDDEDLSTRNKTQQSIVAGISDALFGTSIKFQELVYLKAKTAEGQQRAIQASDVFWNDVAALVKEKIIKDKYYILEEDNGKVILKVAFATLYTIWEKHYKSLRKNLPMSREALLTNMRVEPYFYDYRRIRFMDERPFGMVLRFCKELPEGLISFVLHQETGHGQTSSSLTAKLLSEYDKHIK